MVSVNLNSLERAVKLLSSRIMFTGLIRVLQS